MRKLPFYLISLLTFFAACKKNKTNYVKTHIEYHDSSHFQFGYQWDVGLLTESSFKEDSLDNSIHSFIAVSSAFSPVMFTYNGKPSLIPLYISTGWARNRNLNFLLHPIQYEISDINGFLSTRITLTVQATPEKAIFVETDNNECSIIDIVNKELPKLTKNKTIRIWQTNGNYKSYSTDTTNIYTITRTIAMTNYPNKSVISMGEIENLDTFPKIAFEPVLENKFIDEDIIYRERIIPTDTLLFLQGENKFTTTFKIGKRYYGSFHDPLICDYHADLIK